MSRDIKDTCAGPVPTFHLGWKAVRPRTQSNASKTHEKTALEMPNKDRCRFVLTTNLCTHLIHRCNRVVKLGPGRLAGRHFHHCATYAPDISLLPAAQNAITPSRQQIIGKHIHAYLATKGQSLESLVSMEQELGLLPIGRLLLSNYFRSHPHGCAF